jgi:hypothetical protein
MPKDAENNEEMLEAIQELRSLPRPNMDFTTPEGAILCLEDAYRRRDLEAAVACKDFTVEAVLLLHETMPEDAGDAGLIAKTSEVLELGFRKELSQNWPNMDGVESFFVNSEPGFQDLAIRIITEVSLMPDGTLRMTRMRVGQKNNEWKVLNVMPHEEADEDGRVQRHNFLSSNSALPEVEGRYRDCIIGHIEARWGKSELFFEDDSDEFVQIQVHLVKPTKERPFNTLITSGMSDRPMTTPDQGEEYRLAELVISLPPDWPLEGQKLEDERYGWPVQWLQQLARFPHEYESWLFYGHTVPNGDPPEAFAPGSRFCCILIASPVLCDEGGERLVVDEKTSIYFHSLIPIHRKEMDFALKKGSEALIERLGKAEVNELLDTQRNSAC